MKVVKNKTLYYCDFCNKRYFIPGACEKHEKICSKNPENDRACFGCIHAEKKVGSISDDTDVLALFCNEKKHWLIPPKAEHRGNAYEFNELNEPMPKECELRDDGFQKTSFF